MTQRLGPRGNGRRLGWATGLGLAILCYATIGHDVSSAGAVGAYDGAWSGYIESDCAGRSRAEITIEDGEVRGFVKVFGTGESDGRYSFTGYIDRKGRLSDGRLVGREKAQLSGRFDGDAAKGRMSGPDCHGLWRLARTSGPADPVAADGPASDTRQPIRTSVRDEAEGAVAATQTSELGLTFGAFHAVVIGNNDYADMTDLKTAVTDARAVGALLAEKYGFTVHVLENATRHSILQTLAELRASLSYQDNLLIYYAGHGFIDSVTERGYWLPVDAEPDNTANWVSNADITDLLKAIAARHILVIADSCYSGMLTRSSVAQLETWENERAWLERVVKKRSRTALSSGGLEPVVDGGGGRHSVFAKALLDALRDNDRIIDAQSLFIPLRQRVVVNADQTPQYADIRLAGHEGGDFVFVPR